MRTPHFISAFLFSAVVLLAAAFSAAPANAVTAPAGFIVEDAFPGASVNAPVQVLFMPDGRKLVVEQEGKIWLFFANGVQSALPFLDLELEVLGGAGRGLLGVALDPDYDTDPWIYVTYSVDPNGDGADIEDETWCRVERYRADAIDPNVVDVSTREYLIGETWPEGIPVLDTFHIVGMLRFAADGTLLVASGDGAHFDATDAGGLDPGGFGPGRADPAEDIGSFRSQSLESMCGKMLRIDPETGLGIPSNPWYEPGDPGSDASRSYHYGLRNAFRFSIRPGTGSTDPADGDAGVLYLGGVGWNTYEEFTIAKTAGLNLGWPCQEGPFNQPQYQAVIATAAGNTNVLCGAAPSTENPLAGSYTAPALWWEHFNLGGGGSNPVGWTGNSATGGTFIEGSNYPAPFEGSYFIADFVGSWVRAVHVDGNDSVTGTTDFLTAADGPTNIEMDPATGDMIYTALNSNAIRRIRYVGTPSASLTRIVTLEAAQADGAGPYPVPGTGSPWVDIEGTHDFTLANFEGTATSGWTGTGDDGNPYALQFDGADSRATTPAGSVPELQAPTSVSTSMWIKTGTDIASSQYLFEWLETYLTPFAGMTLQVFNGNLEIFLNPWEIVRPLDPETWYHVAVAKEPGEVRVYVDGRLEFSSASNNLGSQVSEIVLGASTFNGAGAYGNFFSGAIGQVCIWDGAMELADAFNEYDAGRILYTTPVPPPPGGPIFFARADSADGALPPTVPGAASPWVDVLGPHDLTLVNFGGDASSGWQGDGALSPYRLSFDGADDYATIAAGSVPELQFPSATAAEMWFRTSEDIVSNQYLLEWLQTYASPYAGMTLAVEGGELRIFLNPWQSVMPVSTNTWYHVVASKQAGQVRVYVNGQLRFTSSSINLGSQVSEIVVGASTFQGPGVYGNYFSGDIAQVRIYSTSVNSSGALAAYQESSALFQPPPVGTLLFARADQADGASPPAVPGAASPWVDTENTYDLTLNNFAGDASSGWQGDGTLGQAYRLNLDGVDDFLTVPAGAIPELQFPAAASAEMWFRTSDDITTGQYLFEWLQTFSGSYSGMTFEIRDGNLRAYLNPWSDVLPVTINTWYHVVMAKEAGEVRVYVNGVREFTSASTNLGAQLSEIVVGASTFRGPGVYGEYFSGDIAQVRVYDLALDDAGALAAYQENSALFDPAPPTGTLMFTRADQADGAVAPTVPGAASPWVDVQGTHDLVLNNFAGDASSGWQGAGISSDPYRLSFDGADDYAATPAGSIPELQTPTQYSAEMWFETGTDISSNQYLMEWVATFAAPYAGVTLGVDSGNLQIFLNPWATIAPVQPSTWYHLLVTKSLTEVRVYLDGALAFTSATPNLGAQNSEVVVGASTFRGAGVYGEYFTGAIGQVRLYDFVLDAGQADTAYQEFRAFFDAAATGLLHVRADQADGLNPPAVPGAASPWVDLIGPYDLTLSGFDGDASSGWQGDGTMGNAHRLLFDGTNDLVTLPGLSIPGLQSPATATAELWLRTGASVTGNQYVMEWLETFGSPFAGMTVGIDGGNLRVFLNPWTNVAPVVPNTWYHVVVAKEAGEVRVYVNGSRELTSAAPNLGSQVSEIVLGASTFAGAQSYDNYFGGEIAQFRIYAGALDDSDALAAFEESSSLYRTGTLVFARADQADGASPYPVPGNVSPWIDLAGPHDLTLNNFAGDASSGWQGSGLLGNPYRLAFDGVDDVATIPAATIPELQVPGEATAELWFRTSSDIGTSQYLLEWLEAFGGTFAGMTLAVWDGSLQIFLNPWAVVAPVEADTWYHALATKRGNEVQVYLNGALVFTSATPNLGGQVSEVVVGAGTFGGAGAYSNFFGGDIAQVRLYDTFVDATTALAAFQESEALFADPPEVLLYARADQADGAGPYAAQSATSPWVDLAGGHDLALNNFVGSPTTGWQGSGLLGDPYHLSFNGANNILTVPAASIPLLQAPVTASAELWVRTGSSVSNNEYLLEWVETFGAPFAGMTLRINSGQLEVFLDPWTPVTAVTPDTWYHVLAAKEAGEVRVYVNGTRLLTGATPNLGGQISEFVVGGSTFQGAGFYGNYFGGDVAQVRLYSIAVDDARALAAYQESEALYAAPPAGALLFSRADKADGVGSPTVPGAASPWADLIGGNDLTLTNFAGNGISGWQGDGTLAQPWRLSFDGSDDRATLPGGSIAELQSPTTASAELWFRTGTDITTSQYLLEWLETFGSPFAGMTLAVWNSSLQIFLNPGPRSRRCSRKRGITCWPPRSRARCACT